MIDAARLRALARKYEALADLRRAHARGEAVPEASVFKALAREFPGCLAELDTLPLDTIDARAAALAHAASGGSIEPWMEWLADYHSILRAALRIKPRVARGAALDDDRAEALARDAVAHLGVHVDAAFVRAVAAPPEGRLVTLVLTELSLRHGHPAATIKRAIFPAARR
ncbi:Hypothetical protein A7982_00660 [Minicystis rosea]|nr:Hypothetical protein A7982_00660 [Minicystis rosea]